jgi:hypothetical protein
LSVEQFAGDDRVGAAHDWWIGHQDVGGGDFMLDSAHVAAIGDQGLERYEHFDAGDETGVTDRLLELQPDPDVRSAWKAHLAVLTALNARDWPRLRACFAEDVRLVDYRPAALDSHPVEVLREPLAAMPDARAAIQFLDGGADRAMSRCTSTTRRPSPRRAVRARRRAWYVRTLRRAGLGEQAQPVR